MVDARYDWRRYGLEMAVIVVSILLALMVDAAWGYVQDRSAERAYLHGLRTEFLKNKTDLDSDEQRRGEILSSISATQTARESGEVPPGFNVRGVLFDLLDYRFYNPSHPLLEDLVASGNLRLIRSDRLRNALLDYNQKRARIGLAERHDLTFVADAMEPYLASRLPLDRLLDPVDPAVPFAASAAFEPLLADEHFGSLLYLRLSRLRSTARFGRLLDDAIQQVLDELAAAIGDGDATGRDASVDSPTP